MGKKEWVPADIFDVFGDALARRVLVLASDRPRSADDLADELSVSRPTVYRRVNALVDYDLLRKRPRIDGRGNHYQTYVTTLRRISFEVDDGGYDVDLELRRQLADQFDAFWSDLEGAHPDRRPEPEDRPDRGPLES